MITKFTVHDKAANSDAENRIDTNIVLGSSSPYTSSPWKRSSTRYMHLGDRCGNRIWKAHPGHSVECCLLGVDSNIRIDRRRCRWKRWWRKVDLYSRFIDIRVFGTILRERFLRGRFDLDNLLFS